MATKRKAHKASVKSPNTSAENPPPLADDLLNGADAIAAYLGWSRSRVFYSVRRRYLPIGNVGSLLIARKSELNAALTGLKATEAQ